MDISNHPWHLYLMSAIYIIAGLFHFIAPTKYREIVPRYIPYRNSMVFWSGIAEIIIGIGSINSCISKSGPNGAYFDATHFFNGTLLYAKKYQTHS